MARGTKSASDKQEKLIAHYLGWKQVSGSGSRPMHPGDVVSDNWLGECKTHLSAGNIIAFKFDVWDKLADEAISQFKLPALFVDDGSQTVDKTFVMIEMPPDLELPDTVPIDDFSNRKSYRFKDSEFFESSKTVKSFVRSGKRYCIMWLPQFSSYLKYT